MFKKTAKYTLTEITPLNSPDLPDYIKDQNISFNPDDIKTTVSLIKEAESKSAVRNIDGDNTEFDLEAEIKNHPDSLFVKMFAILGDSMNDNGDYFSADELKKSYQTFVGVPVFTNHQNTDVENARGKIVHSWWDENKNGIMVIGRVDAEAYPQLARAIKEKYIIGSSMGAQVEYSICSICHQYASEPSEYCNHIKERKTRHVSASKQKCCYHNNGTEEKCPICGSTKKNTKIYSVDCKSFEYNYGIKFIENSFVVSPACHDCGVTEVIDPSAFLQKAAAITKKLQKLIKAAESQDLICDDKKCVSVKTAGQKEIEDLNQSLELISSVCQTILQQKDQIDLEFLSDLVKVVADLQKSIDELTEQGYGRLASPGQEGVEGAVPGLEAGGEPPVPTEIETNMGGVPSISSGPAGPGSVTGPLASEKQFNISKQGIFEKKKDKIVFNSNWNKPKSII